MDDDESTNSEIRYITIELMKIAHMSDKKFDLVCEEFVENTIKFKESIKTKAMGNSESVEDTKNAKIKW